MRAFCYCTALLVACLTAHGASAQPAAPQAGEATFNIFLRGTLVGQEHVTLARESSGWAITANGHEGQPLDLTVSRFELKYTPDWQPIDLKIEAILRNQTIRLATSFGLTTAVNEITQNGVTNSKTDQISARTVVLPNNFFAAYEGLAARLTETQPGGTLPIYVAPQTEVRLTVRTITPETIQTPAGTVQAKRYDVSIMNPGGPVDAAITVDNHARLVRVAIPSAGFEMARDDASSVASRPVTARNPTDADVSIPANGFNLAATITTPPGEGRLRYPAVLLIGGSGPTDRDETVVGVAIFAQLARSLADQGYIVLRYDKRGVGRSGGRTETVTLSDYADDAIAAVKWLEDRTDVDKRHIAIAGHSEGGAVALLAAPREKQIDAVILMAAPGTTGADLILQQQQHLLEGMKLADTEKQAKIDLQKKIQAAVISGTGWEGIPPALRRQADTPWFRSLLTFDPARAMPSVKQPVLIVQGDLDTQVFPPQADRLGELARARKKAPPVEVVHIPGVNHLFLPATTGEVSEYPELSGKTITPVLGETIGQWLKRIW